MRVLLTGVAGFIGMHCAANMLDQGHSVLGIDNIDDYYDKRLKKDRLALLAKRENFLFHKIDILSAHRLNAVFENFKPDIVLHLAAQAGVRYSITNPDKYIDTNIVGFFNILEACKKNDCLYLFYASSSSVYGGNLKQPFEELDNVDNPLSLYAATKKSNELMAHVYSHLYGLSTIGLRFFTVYGPWGRPDMSPFLFADAITNKKPIKVFNGGDMRRDLTFIGDVVESISRIVRKTVKIEEHKPQKKNVGGKEKGKYKIFNVGNGRPVSLMSYISELELAFGLKATKELFPMQPGDVKETFADTTSLKEFIGYTPETTLKAGVKAFAAWYIEYYQNK